MSRRAIDGSRPVGRGIVVATLLLAGAAAGPARGAELLVNGSFDTNLSGWVVLTDSGKTASWSPLDADGSPSSGSAEAVNRHPMGSILETPVAQCTRVEDELAYRISAEIRVPPGQPAQGEAWLILGWYPNDACVGDYLADTLVAKVSSPGAWVPVAQEVVSPDGADSVRVWLGVVKFETGETFRAQFDEVSLQPADGGGNGCEALPGPYLTDSDFPGFRFKVEITSAAGALPGTFEPGCLPETLCVSGALAGRTEVQVRLIGPRPNGYLWIQVVRFTPSKIRVLAEKPASGACQLYTLDAIPPASDDLDGFVDRTAFLP